MPTTELGEVLSKAVGASFHRADLHIHSFNASHDVKDSSMTPAAIVATAKQEGLRLIAVTDHNEIINVEAAIEAGEREGVYVVPGVELSTSQGHILCYLPTLTALQTFYGHLSIADRGLGNSRCQQSLLECLNLVVAGGGFAVLAHIDVAAGFEFEVPGASPHKLDVLCHGGLLGIELKHAASGISYADSDPDGVRRSIGAERIARLRLGTKQSLARVLNSDAHSLLALGRNAEAAKRVTRYKMDAPSFQALRLALEDADARVRIEDLIPEAVPRILGIRMDGGFLGGECIQFSPNLNCIIGGRGTGKSTTFEAVRALDAAPSESKVIDSEVWPQELNLYWQDKAGQTHSLYRAKGEAISNLDDEDQGPVSFDIDCFGQGEAARISIEAQTNPLALLSYLDKFVDLATDIETENELRDKLLELQTSIEAAQQKVALIPQYERNLATTKQQLAALQKPEVKELVDLQRTLAGEKEVRTQLTAKLREAQATAGQGAVSSFAEEFRGVAQPDTVAVGADEYQAILTGVDAFEHTVKVAETSISSGLAQLEQLLGTQFTSWRAKEAEAQKKIDAKRRELEALKVTFDMSYIAKLAADEANQAQWVKNLNTWIPALASRRKERAEVLKKRWAARERIATLRDTMARKATATLREALSDLQVSLKYAKNAHSPEASDLIIATMGWRTNQQVRAGYLVERLTIPVLLEAIAKNDTALLTALVTPEGVQIFGREEAQAILDKLREPVVLFQLERVALYDLPRLQITRAVAQADQSVIHVQRDFSKLSLGQQQSVLLALMLASDSERPLIIDQPEDNLDGEFIYKTLVPVLRRAKERRQVIIVTHNPNVAVLGDAELIVVLKAFNDRGTIVARGSIDHPETRDAACAILEGAREAFLRRAKTYGVRVQNAVA